MSDLVERLRARNGRPDGFGIGPVCDEAADRIERLEAENAALRVDAERLTLFEDWLSDRSWPLLHIDDVRAALKATP
jgi:hypothetical protein